MIYLFILGRGKKKTRAKSLRVGCFREIAFMQIEQKKAFIRTAESRGATFRMNFIDIVQQIRI